MKIALGMAFVSILLAACDGIRFDAGNAVREAQLDALTKQVRAIKRPPAPVFTPGIDREFRTLSLREHAQRVAAISAQVIRRTEGCEILPAQLTVHEDFAGNQQYAFEQYIGFCREYVTDDRTYGRLPIDLSSEDLRGLQLLLWEQTRPDPFVWYRLGSDQMPMFEEFVGQAPRP